MKKIYILFFAGFLLALNIFCWKEVFVLASESDLKLVFMDVGQGDSSFIETPELHQIIIDGGPTSAVLEKLAKQMPFWDRTLDLIILTHPEKDHMQGLIDILKRYKTDYILWTGIKKSSPEYAVWLDVLERQKKMGAKIIIAESGQEIKAGQAVIRVLYPSDSLAGQEPKDTNNTSVVSRLLFGQSSFLFTGDISIARERELVKSANLKSDVLKIAHHGSKYSSSLDFLQEVKSKIALIGVGADNSYGHPTPETLQRLEDAGAEVLRTDQKGDITILSDGNKIQVQ